MKDQPRQAGIIHLDELRNSPSFPSEKRLMEGPVAIIECLQDIPCNPCEFVCPEAAIKIGQPLTNLPVFREDKCTGCALCVPHCPGMAIFVVDLTYSHKEALIHLPYEFLPLPATNDSVDAIDREGVAIAKAKVKAVRNPKKFDQTVVIAIIVPKDLAMEIRSIRTREEGGGRRQESSLVLAFCSLLPAPCSFLPQTMCRCEEIRDIEVKEAIDQGAVTIKGIKNRTRAGMGLCQGRICANLFTRLLSENANLSPADIKPPSARPPVRPIELGSLAAGGEDD